jgi:hypothetical protein
MKEQFTLEVFAPVATQDLRRYIAKYNMAVSLKRRFGGTCCPSLARRDMKESGTHGRRKIQEARITNR